jgi:hypothetical protein
MFDVIDVGSAWGAPAVAATGQVRRRHYAAIMMATAKTLGLLVVGRWLIGMLQIS